MMIKLKLKKLGARAAIVKAIEEVNELLLELETLLMIWDEAGFKAPRRVAHLTTTIAEEYSDVEIAVKDTFVQLWGDKFTDAMRKKRKLVYEERLPNLLTETDYVE